MFATKIVLRTSIIIIMRTQLIKNTINVYRNVMIVIMPNQQKQQIINIKFICAQLNAIAQLTKTNFMN